MAIYSRRSFIASTLAVGSLGGTSGLLAGCRRREPTGPNLGNVFEMQSPWVNDAEFIGYFIAIANGYYGAEKLNYKYLSGGPDKISGEVLAAGNCDLALTNIDGTAEAIVNGQAPFKIVGTQYQKSPLGVVSLKDNGINSPQDLKGKRLAVPAANKSTTNAFLRLNGIDPLDVGITSYQYDPAILVDGSVDATVDFVTNVPYTIRLQNVEPTSFLFYDYGFKQFMDTVVVREDTLRERREDIVKFLRASRKGWDENFKDVYAYPPKFENTFFAGTGRTVDNEIFFNQQQQGLMETPNGIFSMSEKDIQDNIESLRAIGINLPRDAFVTDLLDEL